LKGLSIDKLFGLPIKTTKDLKLTSTEEETVIQVRKGRVLFLQRVGVTKWIEKI